MNGWTPQLVIGAGAIGVLSVIAGLLMYFTVPSPNHDFFVYILGVLSGAATTGGAVHILKGNSNDAGGA